MFSVISILLNMAVGHAAIFGEDILQNKAKQSEKKIAVEYENAREKLVLADLQSREVMARIYEINLRMKSMSRKRDNLNNRMISVEGNVKNLARSISELESRISQQRHQLKTRLRAIYMLGEEGVARIIFSSTSPQELDQSLKYLKLISDNDYHMIKSFEKNLKTLSQKRDRLNAEVRSMLVVKEKLKAQESLLNSDQATKARILSELKSEKDKTMQKLAFIRGTAEKQNLADTLDISFYENKGKLRTPVNGDLLSDFGLIENEEFKYRLSHKGHRYKVAEYSDVRVIFNGQVSFVGAISGYGNTVIIDHGDHYYSVYADTSRPIVREGQKVKASDIVAKSTDSLYFEIRHFSDAIDPKPWLMAQQ